MELTLIQRIQKSGSQVVICTPTLIGEKFDATNENDGDLNYFVLSSIPSIYSILPLVPT